MKKPPDEPLDREALRDRIIGLGERSFRKSHYPELKARLADLARSVEEHERTEQGLRELEERYRALFEQAADAIVLTEPDSGAVVQYNRATGRLFGRTPAELDVARVQDLVEGELLRSLLLGGPVQHDPDLTLESWIVTPAGETRHVQVSASTVSLHGREYVQSIWRDVTWRKQEERARIRLQEQLHQAQKLEAMGRLAGGVAHDFNNLLTAIQSSAALVLQLLPDDDPVRESVSQIERMGDRAEALVRQLLAFGRKQEVNPRVVELNAQLLQSRTLLERTLGEDVDLRFELADVAGNLWIDPGQLDQILVNLAVNARDAMTEGGVLTVETVAQDPHESGSSPGPLIPMVRLSVRDTGVGMEPELLDRIFEPFFTTKPAERGSGLGLAVVYGIVQQHGGRIQVESSPGQGTTFHLLFPRLDAPASVEPGAARLEAPTGTETVLVVEDEEIVRRLTARILSELGYTVLTASELESALQAQRSHDGPVDLLLCDVVLPGVDGPRVYERLRAQQPDLRVVFMSGYAAEFLARRGLDLDEVPVLVKPFRTFELAQRVRAEIARRSDSAS